MPVTPDLVIRGGTVVDGSGAAPFVADVAARDGVITAVSTVSGKGVEEIDASGLLVTPGFIDIHTHYDGQATWSDSLYPSSAHGVTTAVIGNCGVGFAPCRPGDRDALINVMMGVEDIPEAVMEQGLPWTWQSFPEFMDALAARRWDMDVAAFVPHSPLRVYAMGRRGLDRQPATAADRRHMAELVEEGMAAGALGFATSRTLVHRTGGGHHIPSFEADLNELRDIAHAVAASGRGVIQMVPNLGSAGYRAELDLLVALAEASTRPVTFTLAQSHGDSATWREALDRVRDAALNGARLVPQVFPRPMGIIVGLTASLNPFSLCPSFAELEPLPLAARVERMREPAMRRRLLCEIPADATNPLFLLLRDFERMFPMATTPTYEPAPDASVAGLAAKSGLAPLEVVYDLLLEEGGHALLYLAFANYADCNLDAVREMMVDANTVIGLGDGGAHYGLICDASYPTTLLAYWTRDRATGTLPLGWAIKALSSDPAALVGLSDRGRIAPGLKADINLIDHAAIRLTRPHAITDLPGGGRRLVQDADGFRATFVNGELVRRNGQATGARPGRLVRGGTHMAQPR